MTPKIAQRQYAVCPACQSADKSRLEVVDVENVQRLATPFELEGFPGLVRGENARHLARAESLLAYYRFDDSVACSYENHNHAEGFVVKAYCGRIVCMGSKCGGRFIEGFKEISRQAKSARDYQNYQVVIESELRELPALLDRVSAEVFPLFVFRKGLKEDPVMLGLYKEMRGRFDQTNIPISERGRVMVNGFGNLAENGTTIRYVLAGLQLFDTRMNEVGVGADAREKLAEIGREARTWRSEKPSARRMKKLREDLQPIREKALMLLTQWLPSAALFGKAENLEQALFACRITKVEVGDWSLRYRRQNGTGMVDTAGASFAADPTS